MFKGDFNFQARVPFLAGKSAAAAVSLIILQGLGQNPWIEPPILPQLKSKGCPYISAIANQRAAAAAVHIQPKHLLESVLRLQCAYRRRKMGATHWRFWGFWTKICRCVDCFEPFVGFFWSRIIPIEGLKGFFFNFCGCELGVLRLLVQRVDAAPLHVAACVFPHTRRKELFVWTMCLLGWRFGPIRFGSIRLSDLYNISSIWFGNFLWFSNLESSQIENFGFLSF